MSRANRPISKLSLSISRRLHSLTASWSTTHISAKGDIPRERVQLGVRFRRIRFARSPSSAAPALATPLHTMTLYIGTALDASALTTTAFGIERFVHRD